MRAVGVALATIGYPFLVYAGMDRIQPRYLALLLMSAYLLRWQHRATGPKPALAGPGVMVTVGASFLLATSFLNDRTMLLGYPIVVSAAFLVLFAHSLINPPTVVERIARLREPDLPPQGVAYTRKVTRVWCLFFLLNGVISAATVWLGDIAVWTLYNGFLSYVVMGVLFAGELLVRNRVRKTF